MDKPNVFISWSRPRALELATALKQFVPDVIQDARPWMSAEDIDKGARWSNVIAETLDSTDVGIICLTPENISAPWILFESGALAKKFQTSLVCAYLFDLDVTDVPMPLAQFNLTRAEREDTWKLIQTLNRALGGMIDESRLRRTFDRSWPDFEKELARIRTMPSQSPPPKRDTAELLGEVVERLQGIERRIDGASVVRRVTDPVTWREVLAFLESQDAELGELLDQLNSKRAAFENAHQVLAEPEKAATLSSRIEYIKLEISEVEKIREAVRHLIRVRTAYRPRFH